MSRSGLAAARTDEIGDEKHYRHKIDGDGESDLVSEVLRTTISASGPSSDSPNVERSAACGAIAA